MKKLLLFSVFMALPFFAGYAAKNCEGNAEWELMMIEDERPDIAAKLLAINDRHGDELFSEDGTFIEAEMTKDKVLYRLCMQTFYPNVSKEEVDARWKKIEGTKREAIKNIDELYE